MIFITSSCYRELYQVGLWWNKLNIRVPGMFLIWKILLKLKVGFGWGEGAVGGGCRQL